MHPQSSLLDLVLAFLGSVGPTLLFVIIRNRKLAFRFLQLVFDLTRKQAEKENRDDRDDGQAAAPINQDEFHKTYMAYVGAVDKRVDLVADVLPRFDAAVLRLHDTIEQVRKELNDLITETGERLRVRLDSQLLNDARLHRQQNERLDNHEERLNGHQIRLGNLETIVSELQGRD